MSPANVLAWSLQIGLLVTVAAAAAALLRLRVPAARLFYWQIALLGCLALPLVRPWRQEVDTGNVSVSTITLVQSVGTPAGHHMPLDQAALWLLAAGVVARAFWLGAGFWRLRQYRRRSRLLETREGVALRISEDVASPVTFGARRPVVLLPAGFPDLDSHAREAILCHELLHVRRRDWVFTVAEEAVRAVWWFHPAVWWLLGQIQLAREQTVDREVIERTRAREEYIDALLAIAGAKPRLDLAPAPLFLRQRHLKQRVVAIVKEVRMSKTRLISSLAAALGVLAAACWLVTGAFPLAAAPVADSPGVTVELGGATLLHRAPVIYPDPARQSGVQGSVTVQFRTDSRGNVIDAQVLSGPDELRKTVLQSLLNWHFTPNLANGAHQATIVFNLGTGEVAAVVGRGISPPTTPLPAAVPAAAVERTVKSLNIVGLSEETRADLLSRLPVHEGDTLSPETMRQLVQTVRDFDEHLAVTARPVNGDSAAVYIILPQTAPLPTATAAPPPPPVPTGAPPPPPARIRVGGNVQAANLLVQPKPSYPPEAKAARIQGVVKLHATIGKDGAIETLSVISGDPLLASAALEAVRQWVYRPTLLNGDPVGVETEIDVNFTLSQ